MHVRRTMVELYVHIVVSDCNEDGMRMQRERHLEPAYILERATALQRRESCTLAQ
jgi:hypothetical protein